MKIQINEIDGTTYFPSGFYYEHKTITNDELQRLKNIIEPTIGDEKSIINQSLPRKIVAQILFAEQSKPLNYLAYNNLLREFVYESRNKKLPFKKIKV